MQYTFDKTRLLVTFLPFSGSPPFEYASTSVITDSEFHMKFHYQRAVAREDKDPAGSAAVEVLNLAETYGIRVAACLTACEGVDVNTLRKTSVSDLLKPVPLQVPQPPALPQTAVQPPTPQALVPKDVTTFINKISQMTGVQDAETIRLLAQEANTLKNTRVR